MGDLEDDRASYFGLLQQYSEVYSEFWAKSSALGDVAAAQESVALKDIGAFNIFTDPNGDFALASSSKSDILLQIALALKAAIALVYHPSAAVPLTLWLDMDLVSSNFHSR